MTPLTLPMPPMASTAYESCVVSDSSSVIREEWAKVQWHYSTSISHEPVAKKFAELAATWRESSGLSSSMSELLLSPAYQRIIGLGEQVVPIILEDLKSHPDHWFWALTSITGVDPVPESAVGNLQQMTEAWLSWGRNHNLTA